MSHPLSAVEGVGQPPVIGEIIAGLLLRRSFFGWIAGPAPGIVEGVSQFNVQISAFSYPATASQLSFTINSGPPITQSVWVHP